MRTRRVPGHPKGTPGAPGYPGDPGCTGTPTASYPESCAYVRLLGQRTLRVLIRKHARKHLCQMLFAMGGIYSIAFSRKLYRCPPTIEMHMLGIPWVWGGQCYPTAICQSAPTVLQGNIEGEYHHQFPQAYMASPVLNTPPAKY